MVKFQLHFGRFWGIQNDPKKHPKTAFGAQGSLGGLQGTLWGAFGVHFGLILKLSGAKFRAKLVTRSYVTTSPRSHHSTKKQGAGGMGAKPFRYERLPKLGAVFNAGAAALARPGP